MLNLESPTLALDQLSRTVAVSGTWQIHALAHPETIAALQTRLTALGRDTSLAWELSKIVSLDHIGAQLLWNAWGKVKPPQVVLSPQHEAIFARLEQANALALPPLLTVHWLFLTTLGKALAGLLNHLFGFIVLIGQLVTDLGRFARRPWRGPWKEISANIFHIGYQALGITALMGFLIGVVLSYLSGQQLHIFGGDIYLVNILGMSVIRELGPLLAAILVAGRSGSAITAQLGIMRVTEELDAMLVMGLSHGFLLILPKTIALVVSMPLLVIWTDVAALMGGMVAARVELNLTPAYFVQKLPDAVPLANYWIGLGKAGVFGGLIALVACHFGLRIKPNTESLGQGTTISVVTAITMVILADAVFAIVFSNVGYD